MCLISTAMWLKSTTAAAETVPVGLLTPRAPGPTARGRAPRRMGAIPRCHPATPQRKRNMTPRERCAMALSGKYCPANGSASRREELFTLFMRNHCEKCTRIHI
jgi:hypothetical protein